MADFALESIDTGTIGTLVEILSYCDGQDLQVGLGTGRGAPGLYPGPMRRDVPGLSWYTYRVHNIVDYCMSLE